MRIYYDVSNDTLTQALQTIREALVYTKLQKIGLSHLRMQVFKPSTSADSIPTSTLRSFVHRAESL